MSPAQPAITAAITSQPHHGGRGAFAYIHILIVISHRILDHPSSVKVEVMSEEKNPTCFSPSPKSVHTSISVDSSVIYSERLLARKFN